MKNKKDTTQVIITPQLRRRLKLGLSERTKVRRRKERERREQYFK